MEAFSRMGSHACFMPNLTGKKFKLGHHPLKVSFADEERNAIFGSARFS